MTKTKKYLLITVLILLINFYYYINAYCDLRFYECLTIKVYADGTVSIGTQSKTEKSILDLLEIANENLRHLGGLSICYRFGETRTYISYNTYDISANEAKVLAEELVKRILLELNGETYALFRSQKIDTISPVTGKRISFAHFEYNLTGIDFEKILQWFFELRPEDGFISIFNRKFFHYNRSIISISSGSSGSVNGLTVHIYFPNYFDFRVGGSYVFDLVGLLGGVELRASERSWCSIVEVVFERPAYGDVVFEDIYFPLQYRIGRVFHQGVLKEYTITNDILGGETNIPGKLIDNIKIKFKIVEKGYKLPSTSTQFIGYVILIVGIVSLFLVLYFFKVKKR